jgi:predicted PurR-regulated permease PerM
VSARPFDENGGMGPDPRPQIRAWLPHILILAAFVAAVWLLAVVAAPLFEPVLVAAALAILTAPVLSEPLRDLIARKLPRLSLGMRNRAAGFGATIILVFLAFTPLLVVVISQAENLGELSDKLQGIAFRDPETIAAVADSVVLEINQINEHYGNLDLPAKEVGDAVRDFLAESSDVNSAFLSFIFAGTGTLAQVALALVSLVYFYIDGPRLARGLLAYSPLSADQEERLVRQHRRVVLKLLNDTIATALIKGIVLGSIVYMVDHLLGSGRLPFLPIAIVATLITLLPLVGVTMVWLPFAGLAWSQGNRLGAVLLVIFCWGSNFVMERYRDRLSNRLERQTEWMGFLLFLGVVGGLLTYGPKGLIIGPFAVVMVISLGRAWLPLYVDDDDGGGEGGGGDGGEEPVNPPPPAAPSGA